MHKLAIIIPTIGRPNELKRLLHSLEKQSRIPNQVIIVEQGQRGSEQLCQEFKRLNLQYIFMHEPSAAKARNAGIAAVDPSIELIAFMDDDIVLEEGALSAMLRFWESVPQDVGGAAFNLVNPPSTDLTWLKSLPLTAWLGLYSRERGIVLPSGFHTLIGNISQDAPVHWLCATAVGYKKEVL